MQENSPPRIAGNKRTAVNSPVLTPPGTKHTDPVYVEDNGPLDTELKPSCLEDKFGMHPKKKSSSTSAEPQTNQVDEEGAEINLLDQQAYEELLQDLPPPTTTQYLSYDFDESYEFTLLNLVKYNGCKLEEEL